MTTGDLKNNLRKLQRQLRAVHYPNDVDVKSLGCGITSAYLPIYHYVFLDYSQPLGALLVDLKHDIFGKTDLKFIESMYKVVRELFGYKPPVTKDQFFSVGFAECKVIMCAQILSLVKNRHVQLTDKTVTSGAKHCAVTKNPLTVISNQIAANSTNQNQLSSSKLVSECSSQNRSTVYQTNVNNEVLKSKSNQLREHRKSSHASATSKSLPFEMPRVTVIREQLSNFRDAELIQATPGDKNVVSVTNRLRESKSESNDEAGYSKNKVMENEEQKQDDFVLNMLFSVSQTMVELVSRIETMNERLENLESTVQDHLVTNVTSRSSSDDRHLCPENETKSKFSAIDQDADDGNISMTRNLNNILARLTLLENNMKYLNEKQHTVSADINLLVDNNQNNRSVDSDNSGHSNRGNETLVDSELSRPERKHSTDVSHNSLMLDAPKDAPIVSSRNSAVVNRSASHAVNDLYSSIPDSLLTLDSSNSSSISSAIPESPSNSVSSPLIRSKQAYRIVAMLQNTQEMLQQKISTTLPS